MSKMFFNWKSRERKFLNTLVIYLVAIVLAVVFAIMFYVIRVGCPSFSRIGVGAVAVFLTMFAIFLGQRFVRAICFISVFLIIALLTYNINILIPLGVAVFELIIAIILIKKTNFFAAV